MHCFLKNFIIDKPSLCMCTELQADECETPSQNRVHTCDIHVLGKAQDPMMYHVNSAV